MQLTRFHTILLVVGIHVAYAFLACFFGTSAVNIATQKGEIIFLGTRINPHPGLLVMHSALDRVFIIGSIDELTDKITNNSYLGYPRIFIIMIGEDDNVLRDDNNLIMLVSSLPASIPVIWFAVPVVDSRVKTKNTNTRITEFNQKIKELCNAKQNCSFIDLNSQLVDENGNLKAIYHIGDGVNFNERGTQIWVNTIDSLVP